MLRLLSKAAKYFYLSSLYFYKDQTISSENYFSVKHVVVEGSKDGGIILYFIQSTT
jgi:hypothetical protein